MKYLGELLTEEHVPRESFWGSWITEASLTMIYGPRGCGKSIFTLSAAIAMMMAKPYLGMACPRNLNIGYADSEMGPRFFSGLLKKIVPVHDWDIVGSSQFAYISYDKSGQAPSIAEPRCQQMYEEKFQDRHVIIFDNLDGLSHARDFKDSDLAQWRRIQPWFIRLRDQGKAIVLIHHAGKSGDQRGHSNKEDPMDNVIKLQPSDTGGFGLKVVITKGRDLSPDHKRPVQAKGYFTDSGLWWDFSFLEDDQEARAQKMLRLKMPKATVAMETGLSLYRVHEIAAAMALDRRKPDVEPTPAPVSDKGLLEADDDPHF